MTGMNQTYILGIVFRKTMVRLMAKGSSVMRYIPMLLQNVCFECRRFVGNQVLRRSMPGDKMKSLAYKKINIIKLTLWFYGAHNKTY